MKKFALLTLTLFVLTGCNTINGMGKAVSVRLTASARSTDVQWFATDLLYKPGGIK